MTVRVQPEVFDAGAELNSFGQGRNDIGAIVSFTGVVRDTKGDLQEMLIEHYPGMTESAISKIADEATRRWGLADVLVIHRYGSLNPGAPIMMRSVGILMRKDSVLPPLGETEITEASRCRSTTGT